MKKLEKMILKALDHEIIANIVRVFVLVIMPSLLMLLADFLSEKICNM